MTFSILQQPDDSSCGPTCLHAVYRFLGDDLTLERVIEEVPTLEEGGTLAVMLACHALRRGYRATIYAYDLNLFDPTWSGLDGKSLRAKLEQQLEHKGGEKFGIATRAYLEFLDLGGKIMMEDLTPALIRRHLKKGHPVMTGLSATWLYRTPREYGESSDFDDVRGNPTGHFVVICGLDPESGKALVADPLRDNPVSKERIYEVDLHRLVCAILLGVLTYDARLLVVEPGRGAG